MIKSLTPIVAMLSIAGLALFAVSKGIDGAILSTAFTILGGIGGYAVFRRFKKNQSHSPP